MCCISTSLWFPDISLLLLNVQIVRLLTSKTDHPVVADINYWTNIIHPHLELI